MAQTDPELHVYTREISAAERNSLSVISARITAGARVLDLGCGTGAMGRFLAKRDGTAAGPIDGLTISRAEADLAAPHYRRVEVTDLDGADLTELFPAHGYDGIICADVLEHTRHPERILRQCQALLAPAGCVLLSIPNAAYCGLIAELLAGEFRYRPEGLLDATHLRFFTRDTLLRMLRDGGWLAQDVESIERPLAMSEFGAVFDALPPPLRHYLRARPDALTYQFVVQARLAAPGSDVRAPIPGSSRTGTGAPLLYTSALACTRSPAKAAPDAGTDAARRREILCFALPADAAPAAIRLSPQPWPGFAQLHGASLVDADGQPLWTWTPADADALTQAPHDGLLLQGPALPAAGACLLLQCGDDPWVELPIPAEALRAARGGRLSAELGWPVMEEFLALARLAQRGIRDNDAAHAAGAEFERRWHAAEERAAHLAEHGAALQRANDDLWRRNNDLVDERDGVRRLLTNIETSTMFRATRPLVRAKAALDALRARLRQRGAAQAATQADAVDPAATAPVDVIVPVYRGLDDTRRCIESVLASATQAPWRLLVVNDASPEPELADWLRDIAAGDARITLLANAENLGFVASVNRGMEQHPESDVVLLNSDTEVAPGWLDRLRAAAYRGERTATVTPFSNNATICSYPRFGEPNALPAGWDTARLDALFARCNAGQAIDIPTGVGFCLFIRRAALQALGLFDLQHFGHGYGEENDFCMRARAAGWRNLHALDVFVRHVGGVSFGAGRGARMRAAAQVLRGLHPEYDGLVRDYVRRDPARRARSAVDLARVAASRLPVILAVLHDRGGGTERHLHDLAELLQDRAVLLLLRPLPEHRVQLELARRSEDLRLVFALGHGGWDDLVAVLRALGVAHVHYHHLLGHDARIAELASVLDVGYDYTAHDFYAISPEPSLTDHTNGWCGARAEAECCADWRARSDGFLSGARFVIAPSRDALLRLFKYLPRTRPRLRLVPHPDIDRDQPLPPARPTALHGREPLRVCVLGVLSIIKGAEVLAATAALAREHGAAVDFHLLGYGYRTLPTRPNTNLTVHGPYADADLPALLDWLQPHVVWFPARCPETYSYTLSACLRGGWPVVAPDLGAFCERLDGRAWSWIRPWNTSPADWLAFFQEIRDRHFARVVSPEPPGYAAPPDIAYIATERAQDWYRLRYLDGITRRAAAADTIDPALVARALPPPADAPAPMDAAAQPCPFPSLDVEPAPAQDA